MDIVKVISRAVISILKYGRCTKIKLIPASSCKILDWENYLIQGCKNHRVSSHFWHDAAINGKMLIPCGFEELSSINNFKG
jgi:hypothetical protein